MAESTPGGGIRENRETRQNNIRLLESRVSAARAIRDKWQQDYNLEGLYREYLGRPHPLLGEPVDPFHINKFFPTIKSIIPALFLQNPSFTVRSKDEARDPNSVLLAQMGEAVLKSIALQEHHLDLSVRLALLQSFFSIGVLKSSYRPDFKPNPLKGQPMFETNRGLPVRDELTGELKPLFDEDGNPVLEPDEIVNEETYRWDWVNGDAMLLPDAGPDHLRWPWIAEEVTVLLSTARKDPRFPPGLRTQLKANSHRDERILSRVLGSESASQGLPKEDEDEWITYIDMWDIDRQRHQIWADGQPFSQNRFLVNQHYPAGVDRHPYSLLIFNPVMSSDPHAWPVPHTWSWLNPQHEYSERRRQGMVGARRSARKVYFDDSTFMDPEEAVKALQSSEDMQAVKVATTERVPLVQADPPPPGNITEDLGLLQSDWVQTTGSGVPRARNTATEARIAEQSGEAREIDMRHMVNLWLTSAGQKMFSLVKSTLTLGVYSRLRGGHDSLYLNWVARVYGSEVARNIQEFPNLRFAFDQQFGSDRWQLVTREDLEFEADVSVVPGSARPRNMESEKRDFMEFMALLGQVPILTQSRALMMQAAEMFDFINPAMIDEILAASQRAQQIEAIQAGRLQGNNAASGQAAADGGGANRAAFMRAMVGS